MEALALDDFVDAICMSQIRLKHCVVVRAETHLFA